MNDKVKIHQTWTYKYSVFYKIICGRLYFWDIKNINKAIPVTDWPSEWQTENTSNLNIFNIEIFFIIQSYYYNLYFGWYNENKKRLWVSEWLTEGQPPSVLRAESKVHQTTRIRTGKNFPELLSFNIEVKIIERISEPTFYFIRIRIQS